MNEFLKRLKLIDNLITTLPINKDEFIKRLSEITEESSTGIISDTFDVFSTSKNEFKGQVKTDSFRIKRRQRAFNTNMNFAVAKGIFKEHNGELIIETEINGFNNLFVFYYVFLIVTYLVIISDFSSMDNEVFFIIPFLLLQGAIMFAIPYFIMKGSVKRLKYELEREFFYLTKSK